MGQGDGRMMLQAIERVQEAGGPGGPRCLAMGRDVLVIVWDVDHPVAQVPPLPREIALACAPSATLRLPRANGGTRLVWALRRPATPLQLSVSAGPLGPDAALTLAPADDVPGLSLDIIAGGLESGARLTLVATLLGLWSGLFKFARNRAALRLTHDLVSRLAGQAPPARIAGFGPDDLALVEIPTPGRQKSFEAGYLVEASGIRRWPGRIVTGERLQDGPRLAFGLIPRAELPATDAVLVLTGGGQTSIRPLLTDTTDAAPLMRWLRDRSERAPRLRARLLAELASRGGSGPAFALECQARAPLEPRRVIGTGLEPSAEIVTALATSAGTLVTGWWRDPADMVAGIEALDAGGEPLAMLGGAVPSRTFPVDVEMQAGQRERVKGFAVRLPQARDPLLQPRFRLALRSGAVLPLVPPPQPALAVQARATALRAVPPQNVDAAMLADVLGPVIGALHADVMKDIGEPTIIQFGVPQARTKATIVVPLYRVLDFLKFQIAAFAADPWLRDHADIVYVLDSPEQAEEVEHLLGGLHLVHAMPMRLAVIPRNAGFARASNAGAALARGSVLAQVNSDIIPVRAGWLEQLAASLRRRRGVGAVGPKLLFEDGSLQHAGMFFSRDSKGRWLNQHYHKGLPRFFPPANIERVVPAVTGACIVMPTEQFRRVNGFTEEYVIGDYEDSDLCLKINALDRHIVYVPGVEMFHLERKSMSASSDYMRGMAWQYNCWLHGARWHDAIVDLMARDGQGPGALAGAAA
jgi:GT2 family glycosyltransferase